MPTSSAPDSTPLARAFDAWGSMPEATLPRWGAMRDLVVSLVNPPARNMAVLGYPNLRAVLRVLAGCPATRSAALVSPVPGFPERTGALATRMGLETTLLTVHRPLWDSELRTSHFETVLARVPVDASVQPMGVAATITAHVLEMLRIGTPDALFILHLSVRTARAGDQESAARMARRVAQVMHGFGLQHASLSSALVGPNRRTIDVIGWARRRERA